MQITYSITYEVWDEQAIEIGETDERGFDEHMTVTSFRDFIETFKSGYFVHPSSSDPMQANWWSQDGDSNRDYRTGEMEIKSFHPYYAGMPTHQANRIRRILWKIAKG